MKFTFEQGSFTRVIIGLIAISAFLISAIIDPADRKQSLFWAFLGSLLTWQQYTLYRVKKRDRQIQGKQD